MEKGMNILFISKLSGTLFSGPTYSVPNQINAQSKYDNVFWYNIDSPQKNIYSKYSFYHDLSQFPSQKISDLPSPFNRPDLIIFEEVYRYHSPKILWEVQRLHIPYIIVPRSQLTKQGQNRKSLKKKVGNFLIFNQFVRNASAIQYLSRKEMQDSSKEWNSNCFVIPNGIDLKSKFKTSFSKSGIKAVYIGRLEPYQKGLDLLIEACHGIQDKLREQHFVLNLYGTSSEKDIQNISDMIQSHHLSDVIHINQAVFGEEKERILLDSDLFVMTSRFEGQPMGLLEALSYGLPCLITEGTYMLQEIDKFQAGWTADTTMDSIQQALLKMLAEKEVFQIKGKNILQLAKNYDWERIAEMSHTKYGEYI